MDDLDLQTLDEGSRQDLALAASRSRRRSVGAGSGHSVLHLLRYPGAHPKPEDELSTAITSRA